MDIAIRKLEKCITPSISQTDFAVEGARVAGIHMVLLTALVLEEHGGSWCQASWDHRLGEGGE